MNKTLQYMLITLVIQEFRIQIKSQGIYIIHLRSRVVCKDFKITCGDQLELKLVIHRWRITHSLQQLLNLLESHRYILKLQNSKLTTSNLLLVQTHKFLKSKWCKVKLSLFRISSQHLNNQSSKNFPRKVVDQRIFKHTKLYVRNGAKKCFKP